MVEILFDYKVMQYTIYWIMAYNKYKINFNLYQIKYLYFKWPFVINSQLKKMAAKEWYKIKQLSNFYINNEKYLYNFPEYIFLLTKIFQVVEHEGFW